MVLEVDEQLVGHSCWATNSKTSLDPASQDDHKTLWVGKPNETVSQGNWRLEPARACFFHA